MNKTLHALLVSLAFVVLAPADALANPQHERMKRCNAEAREQALKGDERKAFMSTCLKGRHDATADAPVQAPAAAAPLAAPAAQAPAPAVAAAPEPAAVPVAAPAPARAAAGTASDKRKACNQAATEQSLSGAKRKAFIAECAKG